MWSESVSNHPGAADKACAMMLRFHPQISHVARSFQSASGLNQTRELQLVFVTNMGNRKTVRHRRFSMS